MDQDQSTFLNVQELLERSRPSARRGWFWYGVGVFLLVVMASAYVGEDHPVLVNAVSLLALFGLVVVMSCVMLVAVKNQRSRQEQLEAAGELIQLRRWPEAAIVVQGLLSRPAKSGGVRAQALIDLASILARYHRFGDAILVEEHLLENVHMDGGSEHGLRLGRAMAMLREDRLVDADRAINELRRVGGEESGGLALVEIYRDVKTGHSAEAVEIFNSRLTKMRDQLGHRVGDAYGLVARAYELLGDEKKAQGMWEKATTLTPVIELTRRYPELVGMAERFTSAAAPAGAV